MRRTPPGRTQGAARPTSPTAPPPTAPTRRWTPSSPPAAPPDASGPEQPQVVRQALGGHLVHGPADALDALAVDEQHVGRVLEVLALRLDAVGLPDRL